MSAAAPDVITLTRNVWYAADGVNSVYTFNTVTVLSNDYQHYVEVYVAGKKFVYGTDYTFSGRDCTFVNGAPAAGSQVEMVRNTSSDALINAGDASVTAQQAFYLTQEANDMLLFMNNRHTLLLKNNDKTDTNYPNGFPVVQALPDGLLSPDPRLVNSGGFNKAHYRFQSRLPATTPPESMSLSSFQTVIENPLQSVTLNWAPTSNSTLTITGTDPDDTDITISVGTFANPGTVGVTGHAITVNPQSGQRDGVHVAAQIQTYLDANGYTFAKATGTGTDPVGTTAAPVPLGGPPDKHTYNGMLVSLNGYQGGYIDFDPVTHDPIWDAPQSATALNVIANTGRGQGNGKAEGIVVSAQSDYTPPSTVFDAGDTTKKITISGRSSGTQQIIVTIALSQPTLTAVTTFVAPTSPDTLDTISITINLTAANHKVSDIPTAIANDSTTNTSEYIIATIPSGGGTGDATAYSNIVLGALYLGTGTSAIGFRSREYVTRPITVALLTHGTSNIDVKKVGDPPVTQITITPGSSYTATDVKNLVNGDAKASKYITAFLPSGAGAGNVIVQATPLPLNNGIMTNGKQIAVQARLLPFVDPGPNLENVFDSYAYVANTSGTYPGFGAFIAKSKDDSSDPDEGQMQGWYNAYLAEMKSIVSRLIWMQDPDDTEYKGFVTTACGSDLPNPPGSAQATTRREGVWMGIGTEQPLTPLHLRAQKTAADGLLSATVVADLTLELLDDLNTGDPLGSVKFVGTRNGLDIKEMASIGTTVAISGGNETATLAFKTIADGVSGATAMTVGKSVSIFSKLNLGPATSVTVNAHVIVPLSSHVLVDTSGGSKSINTINGGAEGDLVIFRSSSSTNTATFNANSGGGTNILLGSGVTSIVLSNPNDTLMLFYDGTNWVPLGMWQNVA